MQTLRILPRFSIMHSILALLTTILLLTTDFSNTRAVVPPQKPSKPNAVAQALGNSASGIGKGVGNIANGAGKGAGWFFGELLRPLDALRNGMIDKFGVTEKKR